MSGVPFGLGPTQSSKSLAHILLEAAARLDDKLLGYGCMLGDHKLYHSSLLKQTRVALLPSHPLLHLNLNHFTHFHADTHIRTGSSRSIRPRLTKKFTSVGVEGTKHGIVFFDKSGTRFEIDIGKSGEYIGHEECDLGYICCQDFGSSVLGFGQEIKLPRYPQLPSYPHDLHPPIRLLPASWGLTSGSHSPSTIHLTTPISADGQSKLRPAPKIITESLTAVYPPITRDYGLKISAGGRSQLEGQRIGRGVCAGGTDTRCNRLLLRTVFGSNLGGYD